MNLIQVKSSECTKCGICTQVCPTQIIAINDNGPHAVSDHCIACGHCVAICPEKALDNVRAPLIHQEPLDGFTGIDEKLAEMFLRSRRSIREFKHISVPREKIRKILDVARFAPTSGNSQGITYLVVDDAEMLRKITAVTVDWAEDALKKPPFLGSPYEEPLLANVENYRRSGYDVILRNAPCLIIPIADRNLQTSKENTCFVLAYAELFAPTIGLGTCITGFFDACAASEYKPLMDIINIPYGMKVTGGLMVGYPKYTYHRLVGRDPLEIYWP